MVKRLTVFALFFPLFLVLISCGKNDAKLKVGHGGGNLSAALYAAQNDLAADIQQFHSSSDIAYSLLLGTLDAGFVEAEKLASFAALDGFNKLTVVGKVSYPYGATLILRKGLDNRLHELGGLTIAAMSPNCMLLQKFLGDASRLKADVSGIKFEYMAFDAMIPALEASKIDATVIKGSSSIAALQAGHSILYQNWDMEPGDGHCPAISDHQAVLVLLAQRNRLDAVKPLVDALLSAQKLSPDQLRRAVANNTVIPFEILQGQPVPEFSPAGDELVKIFIEAAHNHHAHAIMKTRTGHNH